MARRGALAQQLNAVESLAAVDVVCLDKTGTLTEGTLRVVELVPLDPGASQDARRRARPLRGELSQPERHARGDRRLEGGSSRSRSTHTSRLPRAAVGARSDSRAESYVLGRSGALPARPARRPRGQGGRGRPSRSRLRHRDGSLVVRKTRSQRPPGSRRSGSSSWPSSSARMRARPSTSSAHKASS